jgi:hypothetical protein
VLVITTSRSLIAFALVGIFVLAHGLA